jgi:SAM-dependent methyltransferase
VRVSILSVTTTITVSDSPFDPWARFYDATLPAGRPDRPFFVDFCRDTDGPVLELGCGTGDIYLDLLAAGVDAYGVDISEEMLDTLAAKASDRNLSPTVTRADITDFSFETEFRIVIGPLNIVRHVTTLDEQRAVFRNVAAALVDGGQFVFWVDLPDFDALCEQRTGVTTTQRFVHDGREYDLEIRVEIVDPLDGTLGYAFRYTDCDSGEIVSTMAFEMAIVPKQQFDLLLDDAGFSAWTYYNGTELAPLSTPAEPVICLATR